MSYIGTRPQIATTLADNIVTADKIASGAVTDPKIAAMAATKLTGTIPDANAPSGSVIQVVNSVRTAGDSTTSSSFVATGLTATITPSSATSKILIICTTALYNAGDNFHQYTTIYRGSTNLNGTKELQLYSAANSSSGRWSNGCMTFVDSPNVTSPTTYTVYFRTLVAGQTINYGTSDQPSIMTLMEISA